MQQVTIDDYPAFSPWSNRSDLISLRLVIAFPSLIRVFKIAINDLFDRLGSQFGNHWLISN